MEAINFFLVFIFILINLLVLGKILLSYLENIKINIKYFIYFYSIELLILLVIYLNLKN